MCQQKGFKLRFVCAKKHTTARVEKKNVSVSLLFLMFEAIFPIKKNDNN